MLSPSKVESILRDVGLSTEWINDYQQMDAAQQTVAIERVRNEILQNIHRTRTALECLDYLRYHLR